MYLFPAVTNGVQGYFRGIGDLKITLISRFCEYVGSCDICGCSCVSFFLADRSIAIFLSCRVDWNAFSRGAVAFEENFNLRDRNHYRTRVENVIGYKLGISQTED